jgi:hypothetical protein
MAHPEIASANGHAKSNGDTIASRLAALSVDDANHSERCSGTKNEPRGTKPEGVAWLRDMQKKIEHADSVLVVGGGALGVRESFRSPHAFATGGRHS